MGPRRDAVELLEDPGHGLRRQNYWKAFQIGATCKTAEWEHEQEYGLLL